MTKQQQKQRQSLHIPLLGDEQCYDELKHDATAAQESSAPLRAEVVVENDKPEDLNQGYSIFFSFAMPLFLLIQFAFAFSHQHDNINEISSVSWLTVNLNIGFFAVAIWLYRWACIDSRITHSALLLLPEIITNAVLVILLFDKIATAFVALLLGIQLITLLALAATIHCLCCSSSRFNNNAVRQEEGEEDEFYLENQVDIRIV
jgi:hypothetical protein